MKKVLLSFLCFCLLLSSASCKKDNGKESESRIDSIAEDSVMLDDEYVSEDSKNDAFESSSVMHNEESDMNEVDISAALSSEDEGAFEFSEETKSVFSESKYQSLKELNYVALGDSIARGYGLENPAEFCYPALLSKALDKVLPNTDINFTNYAVDGLTTGGLIELMNEGYEAINNADLITVCIGANNLLGPFLSVVNKHMPLMVDSSGEAQGFDLNSATFIDGVKAIEAEVESEDFALQMENGIEKLETDLVYILQELNKRSPNADIVITTVYSPYHGIDLLLPYLGISLNLGEISDKWVSELDAQIKRIAIDSDCVLVEAYDAFETEGGCVNASLSLIPFTFSFDPHPNLKGHAVLSNLHLRAIGSI